jgi:hypothetical protein
LNLGSEKLGGKHILQDDIEMNLGSEKLGGKHILQDDIET